MKLLNESLNNVDPEIAAVIAKETRRQEDHIELIASENYTSRAVMAAQGSQLTNKYAEGYPAKRYYGGCEEVDVAEQLAIDRAKALFGADYANVQPHSGSQANAAVYMALLSPGDTILGLSLDHGGHLTHGAKPNFSGKLYNAVQYGINPESGEIDYEQVAELAKTHKPKMIVAGFSAYSRIVDWQRFRDIAAPGQSRTVQRFNQRVRPGFALVVTQFNVEQSERHTVCQPVCKTDRLIGLKPLRDLTCRPHKRVEIIPLGKTSGDASGYDVADMANAEARQKTRKRDRAARINSSEQITG